MILLWGSAISAAEVTLLAVLDGDAQKRYPEAAEVALPPKRKTLTETVKEIFSTIAKDARVGVATYFYFISPVRYMR
jgi:hypothetical protein